MNVLVTGGAGYVGSHMVKLLIRNGVSVVTLDNLSTGYRDAIVGGEVIQCDLADRAALDSLFARRSFDGVLHFASFIRVDESVRKPEKYYRNNFTNTLNLLDAMRERGMDRLVFSSSAAVYGEPEHVPASEDHANNPVSPYGYSKLMVERILRDYNHAYAFRSVSLRYFNAAGADPDGVLGERHEPETDLMPLVLQAASGRREPVRRRSDIAGIPS